LRTSCCLDVRRAFPLIPLADAPGPVPCTPRREMAQVWGSGAVRQASCSFPDRVPLPCLVRSGTPPVGFGSV